MRRSPFARPFRFALAFGLGLTTPATSLAQSYKNSVAPQADRDLVVRAMVSAPNKAMLSAQISGRVASVARRAGESFRQGDILLAFDCAQFEARAAAARAALSAAETALDSASRMFDLRSVGKHDVDLARAGVQKARAEMSIQDHDVRNCKIAAPYDGRVIERRVSPHETVKAGDPLLSVLDHRELEMELLVPSAWLRWLKPGTPYTVAIDATGRKYEAEVLRLGAHVDTASRSVQVFGRFKSVPEDVLSGMSGDVLFPTIPASAR